MNITASKIKSELFNEYQMECNVFPLTEAVVFFGSELECLRMAYRFKNKESKVSYSTNLSKWYVSFPDWFTVEFAQKIKN